MKQPSASWQRLSSTMWRRLLDHMVSCCSCLRWMRRDGQGMGVHWMPSILHMPMIPNSLARRGAPVTSSKRPKRLGSIVVETYANYALQLNPKTNKTEFMVKLRGPQARLEMQKLIFEHEAVIQV